MCPSPLYVGQPHPSLSPSLSRVPGLKRQEQLLFRISLSPLHPPAPQGNWKNYLEILTWGNSPRRVQSSWCCSARSQLLRISSQPHSPFWCLEAWTNVIALLLALRPCSLSVLQHLLLHRRQFFDKYHHFSLSFFQPSRHFLLHNRRHHHHPPIASTALRDHVFVSLSQQVCMLAEFHSMLTGTVPMCACVCSCVCVCVCVCV